MTIKRKPQIPRSLPDYEKAAKEFYGMNAKDFHQWLAGFTMITTNWRNNETSS